MTLIVTMKDQERRELRKLRKSLLMGILQDGRSKPIEDALRQAKAAYDWVINGNGGEVE